MNMWKLPQTALGPGECEMSRRTSSMAHRKGLLSDRLGASLVLILVLGILLAGRVLVLNQMTTMRSNIAVLADRQGFLETKSASLQARWNEATSAEVIVSRAGKELGLIRSQDPDLVLVRYPVSGDKQGWSWPDWIENLAGGDPASAGTQMSMAFDGKMVSLVPVTSDQALFQGDGR